MLIMRRGTREEINVRDRHRGGIVGEVKPAGLQSDWALLEQEGDVDYIWQKVEQVIRECVDTTKFTTWFEPLKPLAFSEGTLQVAVPNKFVRSWLMEHYHTLVPRPSRTARRGLSVVFVDDHGAPRLNPAARQTRCHTVAVNGAPLARLHVQSAFTFDTLRWVEQRFAHACMAVLAIRPHLQPALYGMMGLKTTLCTRPLHSNISPI